MRTTVEITETQRRALAALEGRRRLRGYPTLVQEALDAYLSALGTAETDLLLGLEGSVSDADADRIEGRMAALRSVWRTAS